MLTTAPTPDGDVSVLDGFESWKTYLWFFYDRVGMLAAMHERYGSMVVLRERIPFRKSTRQCVIVSGAELNRQVLGDDETYQTGGVIIRGPRGSNLNHLRRGLITVNGRRHDEQRRLASPLFMPKVIWKLYPQMVETLRQELDEWQIGTTVDVFPRVTRMSMLLSTQNLLAGEDPADGLWLAEATTDIVKRAFRPGVLLFPFNLPGTPYRKMLRCADELQHRVLAMMDARPRTTEDSPRFLDKLFAAHRADPQRVKREDVAGQIVVMFAASHETMPKAITWALFLLTQHPRILAELCAEIRAQCGDAPPSFESLEQMPLLDAVTKETLRLLPPAPVLVRRVRKDAQLGDREVRNGDYVLVNAYGTHRDPAVFPHPNQFRPERWFAPAPNSFAYVPFGAGPRLCIAKTLGTVAMNLILSMIVQRFSFGLASHCRIDRSHRVTLEPKHGMPLMIEPQGREFAAQPVQGNLHQMVDLTRSDATVESPALRRHASPAPTRRAA